jgi:polyhydroxyalkanoate synthesis repressor PhaR
MMTRLIKKYKNRRLYDTEKSQYITVEELQHYVLEGISFSVEDSTTGKDITNATLLQIVVEMESGNTQFLSAEMLRQLIVFANHPLSKSFKEGIEKMFAGMGNMLHTSPTWNQQMESITKQWQEFFK